MHFAKKNINKQITVSLFNPTRQCPSEAFNFRRLQLCGIKSNRFAKFYKVFPLLETHRNPEDEVVWLRFEIFLLVGYEKCRFPILKSSKYHTNFTSSVEWLNLDQIGSNFQGSFCVHRTTKFRQSTQKIFFLLLCVCGPKYSDSLTA